MSDGLFSTYRQGENQVTSTFLSVLRRLSLENIDRILQGLLGESSFQLVQFENQVKGQGSVPDARISATGRLWVETKIARDSIDVDQIDRHLLAVGKAGRLLLLTPDDVDPKISDERVIWSSFRSLAAGIDQILLDNANPPSEREAFLLREFLALLKEEGLLQSPEDIVLLIAARDAWPEYLAAHAYICQENRSFQKTGRMAFYSDRMIHKYVPRILGVQDSLPLTESAIGTLRPDLRPHAENLIRLLLTKRSNRIGETRKVVFLSRLEDQDTLKLHQDILNDLPAAFVQGQRYLPIDWLRKNPRTTSSFQAVRL